jgi:hypothetical protein
MMYKTFIRSATSFESFAKARKRTVRRELTYDEAMAMCKAYNDNRDERQIAKGTKMEFTADK